LRILRPPDVRTHVAELTTGPVFNQIEMATMAIMIRTKTSAWSANLRADMAALLVVLTRQ
jgi:hypothetical protein